MRRGRVLAVLGVVLAAAVGVVVATHRPPEPAAPAAEPPGPHTPTPWHTVNYPQKRKPPEPIRIVCAEGTRTRLSLLDGDELVRAQDGAEALAAAGTIEVESGRHAGERGLPIATLLDGRAGAVALELWPAAGEPLRFDAVELARSPRRHVLVRNRRGAFKLLDLGDDDRILLKNLAGARVVR